MALRALPPVFVSTGVTALCCAPMHPRTATLFSMLLTLAMLLALALAGVATVRAAAIYRWVDAQGVVHYSDTPHAGATQVDLPEAQTYAAPPAPAEAPAAAPAAGPPYLVCAISSPASQESLFAPESVHVGVNLEPGLRPGDQLDVTLDGTRLTAVSPQSTQFDVPSVDRGEHTLTVAVRDATGTAVCNGAPVTFYVRQPSVLSPQSPQRGR